ncbi:zinc ABC transporter substrate-binding protein [Jiella marina]|uniref:zinc ABC transporter substrate-binding protein n=1 Tax=Jiella sp. LLJ827 TaxID=2917712 RepID=UPI00210128F5|nr:zinc ABC transporter substrate-binding protein [Jiella sp. LLJ827]MCQ0986336.1 zinc ABC transporter substrate-binding protein [Jiella sp. LLJ827]
MAIIRSESRLHHAAQECRASEIPSRKALGVGLVLALLFAGAPAAAADDAPGVVASIKPVASLVSAVMDGVGEPHLIVEGAASPHTAALKPSDAQALSDAQAIFWIGPKLENFLEKPIASLGSGAEVVALWDADGVEKLKGRTGGMFEAHDAEGHHDEDHDGDHDEEHAEADHDGEHGHHHEAGGINEHVWLDPQNAMAMTKAIAATLAKVDPAHADTYRANAEAYVDRLSQLEDDVRARMATAKDVNFIVFHDAYQYFEHRFGIEAAGSITINPERAPGAARLTEIREKLATLGAACVFSEPEFEPRVVDVVVEGTSARTGVLDPLGADLPAGPDLYPTLIKNIAEGIVSCAGGR